MSEKEKELLNLIRESDNPEEALLTAIEIILKFIEEEQ